METFLPLERYQASVPVLHVEGTHTKRCRCILPRPHGVVPRRGPSEEDVVLPLGGLDSPPPLVSPEDGPGPAARHVHGREVALPGLAVVRTDEPERVVARIERSLPPRPSGSLKGAMPFTLPRNL